ncbi:ATP-binding protein [Candidatus Palauibacter sp.]|uniref:ATP-binding protein n=1 Tax=Candidatus Palauibacter sp. TaxID=3101350 RepID=UPI003AF2547B
MESFERPHVARLVRELTDESVPPLIVAVTGPRQSGKTTLVRQALRRLRGMGHRTRYIALDDPGQPRWSSLSGSDTTVALPPPPRDTEWLVSVWRQARRDAEAYRRGLVLVLDEIQHVKDWSSVVKGLWDADRREDHPLKVVVLGSAAWRLLTGMGDSLAGRFMSFPVRHWSLREMVEAFDVSLDEYVFFGGYPGAIRYAEDLRAWRSCVAHSIIAPTIDRDILDLTRVDRPSAMCQLVDMAPEYSGQVVTYEHLAGRLRSGGSPTTLAHYLDLLSDAGIMTRLSKYAGSAVRRAASNPKLLVLNPGLMTALSGYSFDEARNDRTFWGRIVETAVGAHLHNTLEAAMHLAYWRDDPHEVDFVLFQGPRVLGVEVKSGRQRRALPGLAAFKKRFPKAETLLVGGRSGVRTNQVPLNEFLAEPASHWLSGKGWGPA